MILPKCVIADQPESTDSSRQRLQDSTNRRGHTSQSSAANTEDRSNTAGQQQLSQASRCLAARAARLSRRRAVRPSHWTALCAASRAVAEAAAVVAAAAAIAAEQRAAPAEQRRQDRRHNSAANVRHKGKVQLPPIRRYSPYWTGLLRENNNAGKHFRSFGRRYNQVLSMASTGADVDTSLFDGHGPPTFRIKGKISVASDRAGSQIQSDISTRVQTLSWTHA